MTETIPSPGGNVGDNAQPEIRDHSWAEPTERSEVGFQGSLKPWEASAHLTAKAVPGSELELNSSLLMLVLTTTPPPLLVAVLFHYLGFSQVAVVVALLVSWSMLIVLWLAMRRSRARKAE